MGSHALNGISTLVSAGVHVDDADRAALAMKDVHRASPHATASAPKLAPYPGVPPASTGQFHSMYDGDFNGAPQNAVLQRFAQNYLHASSGGWHSNPSMLPYGFPGYPPPLAPATHTGHPSYPMQMGSVAYHAVNPSYSHGSHSQSFSGNGTSTASSDVHGRHDFPSHPQRSNNGIGDAKFGKRPSADGVGAGASPQKRSGGKFSMPSLIEEALLLAASPKTSNRVVVDAVLCDAIAASRAALTPKASECSAPSAPSRAWSISAAPVTTASFCPPPNALTPSSDATETTGRGVVACIDDVRCVKHARGGLAARRLRDKSFAHEPAVFHEFLIKWAEPRVIAIDPQRCVVKADSGEAAASTFRVHSLHHVYDSASSLQLRKLSHSLAKTFAEHGTSETVNLREIPSVTVTITHSWVSEADIDCTLMLVAFCKLHAVPIHFAEPVTVDQLRAVIREHAMQLPESLNSTAADSLICTNTHAPASSLRIPVGPTMKVLTDSNTELENMKQKEREDNKRVSKKPRTSDVESHAAGTREDPKPPKQPIRSSATTHGAVSAVSADVKSPSHSYAQQQQQPTHNPDSSGVPYLVPVHPYDGYAPMMPYSMYHPTQVPPQEAHNHAYSYGPPPHYAQPAPPPPWFHMPYADHHTHHYSAPPYTDQSMYYAATPGDGYAGAHATNYAAGKRSRSAWQSS